jgi:transcriptional regulator with GAF, ATPase, and Fis domain
MGPQERLKFETDEIAVYSQVTSNVLLRELLSMVGEESSEQARLIMDAVSQTDSITQAAELLGLRNRTVQRTMKETRVLLGALLGLQTPAIAQDDDVIGVA